jgi:hypothetical protein
VTVTDILFLHFWGFPLPGPSVRRGLIFDYFFQYPAGADANLIRVAR